LNLIKQFSNSLWNFHSYRSLSQMKGGKSFLYILLLFLLVYLVGSIYTGVQLSNIVDYLQVSLKDYMPDFRLSEGRFIFDGEMPYRIEEESFLIIIDTTGQTTKEEFVGYSSGILITENELINFTWGKEDITPFSMFGPLEISKDIIVEAIPALKVFITIILAIGFLFAFAGKLFGILVLTLIAFLPNSLFRQQLTFQNLWNVAIYSSTLPTLIKLVNSVLGSPLKSVFLIYWGVAITYVFLGIYYMSKSNYAGSPGLIPGAENSGPNPDV
jgi:hypothetical protein